MAERFASVSEEELKVLIENKDSKNTKRTTKTSVNILNDYLREKNLEEPQDKTALATGFPIVEFDFFLTFEIKCTYLHLTVSSLLIITLLSNLHMLNFI